MADKVKISQEAFQKAISELQTVHNSLESYRAEMAKNYSMMRTDWQGLAGEAFEAQSQKIIKEFELNIFNLDKHIDALKYVAQASAEVDLELARSLAAVGGGNTLQVRSVFESNGCAVDWAAGATAGSSTITVTPKDGVPWTLKEGVDYYIGADGKSYFYNNVRTILEANGATVDYEKTSGGGSIITVTTAASRYTLVEGKDYFVGADGKAHFLDNDTYGPTPPVPTPIPTPAPPPAPLIPIASTEGSSDITTMLNRLLNDKTLGLPEIKKNTIIGIGNTMLNEGYPPAFVAGMLANIIHEGTAGLFESSAYKSNKPTYLQYMDDNYDYRQKFSGKNVTDIKISDLYDLMLKLEKDNWQKGKFGLGCVQWTGGRTKALVEVYKEVAGTSDKLTFEQLLYAEGLMISREFAGAYHSVYTSWLKNTENNMNSGEAARNAGSTICMKYEVPADYVNKSVTRGNTAQNVYKVMMGL